MKEEFNLSDKIENADDGYDTREGNKIILLKDVREFIDILKKEVDKNIGTFLEKYQAEIIKYTINELAGNKLI